MSVTRLTTWAAKALLAATPALASAFPEGSTAPTADELRQRLVGKTFDVKLASGVGWRLEYKDNGFFFIDTTNGFRDSGPWRTEDGRLCSQGRQINPSCNEMRVSGGALLLKRDSGEIVEFKPR